MNASVVFPNKAHQRAYENGIRAANDGEYDLTDEGRAALESFATSLPAARVPDGWVIVPEGDTCLVEHPKWGRYVFHAAPQAGER